MEGLLLILSKFELLKAGQLMNALKGVNPEELDGVSSGGWNISMTVNGWNDARGIIKSDKQTFMVVFRPDADYPEVFESEDDVKVDAIVSNGRISASTIREDDAYIDSLPEPRIDTKGLSEEEVEALKMYILRNFPGEIVVNDEYVNWKGDTEWIQLLMVQPVNDLGLLKKYSGRIYYPTSQEDTPRMSGDSLPVHQTKQDKEVVLDMPIGSQKAVEIMSKTPTYVNKTLLDSLPKIYSQSADVTNQVLNSIDKRKFKSLQNAYKTEGIQELLHHTEFVDAYKKRDYKKMRDILGLNDDEKISESMKILFGISLKDFKYIVDVEENPIITSDDPIRVINVFDDESVKDLSHAITISDPYIRYNDYYDANYVMFTSRGERMYAEGSDNFQSNTTLRKNIRFEPTSSEGIDKADYTTNLMEALGGALVEDKVVKSDKNKYHKDELVDIATKYLYDKNFDGASPRVQNYLKSLKNVDEYGVIDTSTSVTLDSTFSGLAVNSAITGKTANLDKINISDDDKYVDSLNDLYTEVGKPLIDKLVEKHGIDPHEARSIAKKGIMPAMYNSSTRSRQDALKHELYETFKEEFGQTEASKLFKDLKEEISKTTKEATEVLASTVKEKEILDLVNKGIITVYEVGDVGEPVEYKPKTKEDLYRAAGVLIRKPDGTVSLITNGESEVESVGTKLIVKSQDHVKPFTSDIRLVDGELEEVTVKKKLLDNISTAMARTYDSYVASYVVEKLHDEGIPVLTTHDAFTVPVYAMDKTKEYYNEAINNIYKFGGSDVVVDARNNLSVE